MKQMGRKSQGRGDDCNQLVSTGTVAEVLRYKDESDKRKEILSDMRGYACENGFDDLDKIDVYLPQFDEEAKEV